MNLDLHYLFSFVVRKGNMFSNTDILKLILNPADIERQLVTFPQARIMLLNYKLCKPPREKRIRTLGLHPKTGYKLDRTLKCMEDFKNKIFNCQH